MDDELEVHLEKLHNTAGQTQRYLRVLGNSEAVSTKRIEERAATSRKLKRLEGNITKTHELITERDEAIERREYNAWMGEKVAKQACVGLGARVGGGGSNVAPVDEVKTMNEITELQKHPYRGDNWQRIQELLKRMPK